MDHRSDIKARYALRTLNTFGVEAYARELAPIRSSGQLQDLLATQSGPLFILGGGSNILLTEDVDALVLKNEISGKRITEESGSEVIVEVGGGENWHAFVEWCLEQGLGGIENLSLIPGTVGAAPIQNIGAYGVELQDVFERLEAVDLKKGKPRIYSHTDCRFGYRDSVFKRALKGKVFISRVFLRLHKDPYRVNTSYGAIGKELAAKKIGRPTIRDVSEAVIRIRRSKLPDPVELGSAGSFFKNPVLSRSRFEALQKRFPDMVFYPAGEERVKVPAGWLIEQCGWKGKRIGDAGCYSKQALVLVNYGGATGKEIWDLAQRIARSVEETFGIRLATEVNIL